MSKCYISTEEDIASRYPMKVSLSVIDNTVCEAASYGDRLFYVVDDRTFCDGGTEGRSTCRVRPYF